MKKIEIIWRELLYQAIEKGQRQFTQKDVAGKFSFSTSTVFQALKTPRKMGAVRVTGRFFILEDPEKLLYHWASVRDFSREMVLSGRVELPISEIEGRMPPDVVFGGFTAAREHLEEVPADYDKVYVYQKVKSQKSKVKIREQNSEIVKEFQERFEVTKGTPNLFVLQGDKFLANYGQTTTLAQTFVDLWNLPEWYAKEYVKSLKGKIDGLLP